MKIRTILFIFLACIVMSPDMSAARQSIMLREKDVRVGKRDTGRSILNLRCTYDNGYLTVQCDDSYNGTLVVSIKDIDGFEFAGYCVNATETIPFYIGEITEDVHITVTTDTGRTYQGWLSAE